MIDVAHELAKHFDAAALGRERVRFDGAELPLVAPDSIEGFVEAVRFAAREKLALVPIGLGSKLGWLRAPERADFLLSTRRYTGVVSHVPDDGTIAVRAGTRMSELREITRRGGHFLTPDVSHPERKTIGGVIAAGESGADRLRFGPVRHHVLGLKVVLADGTVTKCGGQLVKNVTGFDLMRLYTGSHGTLCVIVEAALRLFPEPEHELWIDAHSQPGEDIYAVACRALALPFSPISVSIGVNQLGGFVAARWFARRDTAAAQIAVVREAWPACSVLENASARDAAENCRDGFDVTDGPYLHVACPKADVPALHQRIGSLIECASGRAEPGVAYLDASLHHALAHPSAELLEVARALRESGAEFALRNLPAEALSRSELQSAPVPGADLMRALKQQLDPLGVFARGRFSDGL